MVANRVNENNKATWQSYLDTGRFNIANHSYTHEYWGQDDTAESGTLRNNQEYSIEDGKMTYEIIESGKHLRKMFPNERVLCFVKPGFSYPADKPQVSQQAFDMIGTNYISMRNTGGDVESIPPKNWLSLRSHMDDQAEAADVWINLMDKAIQQNSWFIMFYHDISDSRQAEVTRFIDEVGDRVDKGNVWCAFLDEATMYVKEAQTANIESVYDGTKIIVNLTDEMDDSIYDYPLTVKVRIPSDWKDVECVQNDKTEVFTPFEENGINYVYANIVPDKGQAVLSSQND